MFVAPEKLPCNPLFAGCRLLWRTTAHWRRCSEPSETSLMRVDPGGLVMPSSFWLTLCSAQPSVETMPQRYKASDGEMWIIHAGYLHLAHPLTGSKLNETVLSTLQTVETGYAYCRLISNKNRSKRVTVKVLKPLPCTLNPEGLKSCYPYRVWTRKQATTKWLN